MTGAVRSVMRTRQLLYDDVTMSAQDMAAELVVSPKSFDASQHTLNVPSPIYGQAWEAICVSGT